MKSRFVRCAAVAVALMLSAGVAPAHAEGAGSAVGGLNLPGGDGSFDGAFAAIGGSTETDAFAANDCRFSGTGQPGLPVESTGTLDITDCDPAGNQISGPLTYRRTATVLDAEGDIRINNIEVYVRIVCKLAVGAYVSVRTPPISVALYIGLIFKCTILVRVRV